MERGKKMAFVLFAALLCVGITTTVAANTAAGFGENEIDTKFNERVSIKTDDEAVEKEPQGEKFEFQAEVSRLMDIIINSLYTNREIFLRELISNASDAIDKIRYQSLTEHDALGEGEARELDIRIKFDKEEGTLSITDKGIGMSREDLINNLGTIAKSGTSNFLEAMQEGGDMSLIGQFGVGFYSVYLVSDVVTVTSKKNGHAQTVWESRAENTFNIWEDTEGEQLLRGTTITMKLKEDAQEFLDETKLKGIVSRYSEFMNYPIYLEVSYEEEYEVEFEDDEDEEDEDEDEEDEDEDEEDDELSVEDEDEDDGIITTKTAKRTAYKWELLNEQKAIWTRSPEDIEDEEYVKFFQSISKDTKDPLTYSHFKAEGEVEFRSILYIPEEAPHDMFDNYYTTNTNIKMYVRRVLITDEFEDLVPRYLRFVRGVVDSDDLPLNVSRETLQEHRVLKVIKKKVVRKILDMIRKMAEAEEEYLYEDEEDEDEDEEEEEVEDEEEEEEEGEEGEMDDEDEDEDEDEEEAMKYSQFWDNFGKNIKLGVMEDTTNKSRLSKLLRFHSSAMEDDEELTGLEDYVERMEEDQPGIYYITGEDLETVKKSPFLEKLMRKGYEVLYCVDSVDEYLFQQLTEFEGHKMMSATKEGMKMDESDDEKALQEQLEEDYEDLTSWMNDNLGEQVEKVVVSSRLVDSPAILVTSQYGWSANMERIMKAQALSDSSKNNFMQARKTLEINPRHPIIDKLRALTEEGDASEAKDINQLLFDSALVQSGFPIEDPNPFADRLQKLLRKGLGISSDAGLLPEFELREEEEEDDDEEDDDEEEEDEDEDLKEDL